MFGTTQGFRHPLGVLERTPPQLRGADYRTSTRSNGKQWLPQGDFGKLFSFFASLHLRNVCSEHNLFAKSKNKLLNVFEVIRKEPRERLGVEFSPSVAWLCSKLIPAFCVIPFPVRSAFAPESACRDPQESVRQKLRALGKPARP